MKRGERSFQFKENYLRMRGEEGKSVKEIADFYDLSYRYVYDLIHQLAEELGVPYDSLLNHPHSVHIFLGSGKAVEPVKPVDFTGFQEESRSTRSQLDKTINEMEKVLKQWPEMPADLKEDG